MGKKLMLKNRPGFDEWLRHEYCDERQTMKQIGKELGCSPATVLNHLRRCGVETRKHTDYEATEKQREVWRRIGHARKGCVVTEEHKAAISQKNKGKRRRDDYEFGGHEKKRDDGYIAIYCPDHPDSNKEGYVMKHRLVMERSLGIRIPVGYVVHHINHIRDDNRIENLALMTFKGHAALHMSERNSRRKLV